VSFMRGRVLGKSDHELGLRAAAPEEREEHKRRHKAGRPAAPHAEQSIDCGAQGVRVSRFIATAGLVPKLLHQLRKRKPVNGAPHTYVRRPDLDCKP
jgi:hypothetical protein